MRKPNVTAITGANELEEIDKIDVLFFLVFSIIQLMFNSLPNSNSVSEQVIKRAFLSKLKVLAQG